jgi:hypothetical protein
VSDFGIARPGYNSGMEQEPPKPPWIARPGLLPDKRPMRDPEVRKWYVFLRGLSPNAVEEYAQKNPAPPEWRVFYQAAAEIVEESMPPPGPPTQEDLERARLIPLTACPRRYCWWWRTASFDWHLSPAEGCEFLERVESDYWKNADKPCCRADPQSTPDHFEPRPYLREDGFDEWRFNGPSHRRAPN